jgi:homoserine dehydrogenase
MSTRVNAAQTSGTSPGRIHLLGAGPVGRALLRRIENSRHTLVAVTDSTGSVWSADGLNGTGIAEWKASGRSLANHADGTVRDWVDVTEYADADIIIDATSSDARDGWTELLQSNVIDAGRRLILAAKPSLAERAHDWLSSDNIERVGCNAVLGGTGHSLSRDLKALRRDCASAAIVGNASTTTIINCIERGASFEQGLDEAHRLGFLESDPELDLRGRDAAVKLAIVAGAITGLPFDVESITCQDIREVDPVVFRGRARQGLTTRLIARFDRASRTLDVAYEAVAVDSVLAPPVGRVVYQYETSDGDRRIYLGTGIGADATADAAWLDVQTLTRTSAVGIAAGAR